MTIKQRDGTRHCKSNPCRAQQTRSCRNCDSTMVKTHCMPGDAGQARRSVHVHVRVLEVLIEDRAETVCIKQRDGN